MTDLRPETLVSVRVSPDHDSTTKGYVGSCNAKDFFSLYSVMPVGELGKVASLFEAVTSPIPDLTWKAPTIIDTFPLVGVSGLPMRLKPHKGSLRRGLI